VHMRKHVTITCSFSNRKPDFSTLRKNNSIHTLYLYLYFRLMDCRASQLKIPTSFQCLSSLFLNALVDSASMTSCGNSFHSLMKHNEKKFCLIVVWHLGLNYFNKCPPSLLVTSDSLQCQNPH